MKPSFIGNVKKIKKVRVIDDEEIIPQGNSYSHIVEVPRDEEMINKDIQYCKNASKEFTLQSSLSMFRSTTNQMLNNIINLSLDPFAENSNLDKRYPNVSLRLSHVYGFEV